MNIRALALMIPLFALACSSSQPPPDTSGTAGTTTAANTGQTVEVPPVDTAKPVETAKPAETTAATTTPAPSSETPGNGNARVAYTACTPEARSAKGCTKEMRPVCGEVDTGIRCIKAPCPSTMQKTFSNPCMACQEPKVQGFWPMSCENMTKSPAADVQ